MVQCNTVQGAAVVKQSPVTGLMSQKEASGMGSVRFSTWNTGSRDGIIVKILHHHHHHRHRRLWTQANASVSASLATCN